MINFFTYPFKYPNRYITFKSVSVRHHKAAADKYVDGRKERGDYEYYENRGQKSLYWKMQQDRMGKLAEFCAYETLPTIGFSKVSLPDTEVYSSFNKNWNQDLNGDYNDISHKIDVKGCFAKPFDDEWKNWSWTYQFSNKNGKGGKDISMFGSIGPNDLFCCVIVDMNDLIGQVISLIRKTTIRDEQLLKLPRKAILTDIKRCVYLIGLDKKNLIGFYI